jgi:hypothetical protein
LIPEIRDRGAIEPARQRPFENRLIARYAFWLKVSSLPTTMLLAFVVLLTLLNTDALMPWQAVMAAGFGLAIAGDEQTLRKPGAGATPAVAVPASKQAAANAPGPGDGEKLPDADGKAVGVR